MSVGSAVEIKKTFLSFPSASRPVLYTRVKQSERDPNIFYLEEGSQIQIAGQTSGLENLRLSARGATSTYNVVL